VHTSYTHFTRGVVQDDDLIDYVLIQKYSQAHFNQFLEDIALMCASNSVDMHQRLSTSYSCALQHTQAF
jgi:hypothetical protein